MNALKSNSSLTSDCSATANSSDSSFLACQLPQHPVLCQENKEHEEFKDISIVDDDQNCSIQGCDLDHKSLACLLSSKVKRYQDHKDKLKEDSPDNNEGEVMKHRLGSLIESDRLSNHGSVSCRSSSRRSFAFPILEFEWPDSPVRMVEAERRQRLLRWRNCFLCCKF